MPFTCIISHHLLTVYVTNQVNQMLIVKMFNILLILTIILVIYDLIMKKYAVENTKCAYRSE